MNKLSAHYRLPGLAGLLCLLLLAGLTACQAKVQQDAAAPQAVQKNQQVAATAQEAAAGQALEATLTPHPVDAADYAKAVMLQGPQFTEAELLKILKDIEPVSRESMYNVVEYLYNEKDWTRERSYYTLSKVASAERILQDGDSAIQYLEEAWPEDMPTAEELALVEKHRARLHELIGYEEE